MSTAMSKDDVSSWKTGKGNAGTPMSNAQAFVYKPAENVFKSTTYVEWQGTAWQDFKAVFAADDVMNLNWQNCVVSDTLWSTDGYGD